jgi:hypothetical protein
MTVTEKATQIADAVSECQDAKLEAAQVDTRLKTVFDAYYEAGQSMNSGRGTSTYPRIEDGTLMIAWGTRSRCKLTDILGLTDLDKLVREHEAANARLEEALTCLRTLGIAGIA